MTSGLRILGIVFTAVGIGLIVLAFLQGDSMFGMASLGFGITGLTFLVMGPIFFFVSRAIPSPDKRLLATGIDGVATIARAATTGWSVNTDGRIVKLTLDVRVPGRESYTVTKRELVAVWDLANLVGQVLPVKVDPSDPQRLELVWDSTAGTGRAWGPATIASTVIDASGPDGVRVRQMDLAAAQALAQSLAEEGSTEIPGTGVTITRGQAGQITIRTAGGSGATLESAPAMNALSPGEPAATRVVSSWTSTAPTPQVAVAGVSAAPPAQAGGLIVPDTSDLEVTGTSGRGTITSISDTGVAIGGGHVYQLGLTVATGGRPTYPVSHAALVPAAASGRLQVGASVAIRVDPAAPDRILFEWDRP